MSFRRLSLEEIEQRNTERRAAHARALVESTLRPLARGSYAAADTRAVPKTKPYRDPVLLELAKGRGCLLGIPGICTNDRATTVAAHSNSRQHGKGKGRKADDCYSVFACFACHTWLDTGPASRDEKALAFQLGHIDQVQEWRIIATDPAEPMSYRAAARRALEHLNASPILEDAP